MFGMHGSRYANYAVQNSDLLIALGARFDDRVTGKLSTFAPEAKIVHLDVDPAEISKLVTATVPLVGDVKRSCPQLTEEVRRAFAERGRPDLGAVVEARRRLARKHPLKYEQEGRRTSSRSTSSTGSGRRASGKAIVTTGVGEHQMCAAQFWKISKPREFITSGGLGTMGFCLPSAIGTQLGRPDELVIGIDGDGSFQMTLQDLATARRPRAADQDLRPEQPVPRAWSGSGRSCSTSGASRDAAHGLPRPREARRRVRLPRAARADARGARPGHRPGAREHKGPTIVDVRVQRGRRRCTRWCRPARP